MVAATAGINAALKGCARSVPSKAPVTAQTSDSACNRRDNRLPYSTQIPQHAEGLLPSMQREIHCVEHNKSAYNKRQQSQCS